MARPLPDFRQQKRPNGDPMAHPPELPLWMRLYLAAYRWRRIDPVPAAPLRAPVREACVALVTTAGLVRSMLGISPDAWAKARAALGDVGAACVVAAILERAEAIRSPGGYLRALTGRAERGQFSLRPMLAALERGDGGS